LGRVEEDATTFKPSGQLIYSYTRPSPVQNGKGKGKGAVQIQNLNPESEDAVVFEVYHVSVNFLLTGELFTSIQDDMEYAWL
jgi:histone acetyltransferase 1